MSAVQPTRSVSEETAGQVAHAAWCKIRFPDMKRDPAEPWQEFTDIQRAAWEAAATAAIAAVLLPLPEKWS